MKRKILFIINPRSGKKNSPQIIDIIKNSFPKEIEYEIGLWTNIEEFDKISKKLLSEGFTEAIAVGGDGSVNLVARTVLNTDLVLGILPTGSGNGLARSIGMSVNPKEAVKQIIAGKTTVIDHGYVNDIPFFCTSGMGFDAHIGKLFANTKTRGLKTYMKMIWKEFFGYKPQSYTLKINSDTITRTAFLITVANAGQYGNNFYIAPQAKLNDGLFHVVVFKPFNLLQALGTVFKITQGNAHKSKFIETYTCSSLTIVREKSDSIHYDGEPETLGTELKYTNHPQKIKVIIGSKFDGVEPGGLHGTKGTGHSSIPPVIVNEGL